MRAIVLLAEQAAPAADGAHPALRFLLENPFAVGLVVLFLAAAIGAFIAARKRDRCLKIFRGFHVTLSEQSGRQVWGVLKVFSRGVELVYETPFDSPAKRSFLMYEGDLGRLLAIHRFADRLDEADGRRRRRQVRRLAHPSLVGRTARWARNVVNTFRDAIVKAMGMTVQQAAQAAPSPTLAAQGGQINAIGTLLIGETANAYEPMIEQYLSRPVILEVVNPADPEKRVAEYHGGLAEYSAQFVMLVDVRRRFTQDVPLDGAAHRLVEDTVAVRTEGHTLHVANGAVVPVAVESVTAGGARDEVGTTVAPGEEISVALAGEAAAPDAAASEGDATRPTVRLAWERTFDLVVPRSVGIVRHASEEARSAAPCG
ncbi:MAG: hypothetical protein R6X20_17055 [Phycisphaerae bacterium]